MTAAVDRAPAPGASASLARRVAPDLVHGGEERPITADQTNVSIVVDGSVIVKWLQPPVPAPHPGLALLEHLRAVGFTDMPPFLGAELVDGSVVALVSGYAVGALDGWDWFVDELTGWVDGTTGGEAVLASADTVGALAARLHVALATPSEVLAQPVVQVDADAERDRAEALLEEALAIAEGEAGDVLRATLGAIRTVLDGWPRGRTTPAIPVHGDLHIGQLLRSPERLVVTDFDGNPLLDAAERHRPRPAAVDVASLVQSIDHAVRVAQHRRPDAAPRLDRLASDTMTATLAAYRRELDVTGHRDLLDEEVLWPLRVTQELHELAYAAHHLPRWAYVPTSTLRAMFGVEAPARPA